MKFNLLILTCLTSTVFSFVASACDDLSGRYIHTFEDSDFRRDACLSVAQNDCNTITVSNWSTTLKNGQVDVVDMTKFPSRVFGVADAGIGSTWHRAAAGECAQ